MDIDDIIEKYHFVYDEDGGCVFEDYEVKVYEKDNLKISKASFGSFNCYINGALVVYRQFIEHLKWVYPEVI